MKAGIRLLLVPWVLVVVACSDPVSVESDILIARVSSRQLELTNTGTQPLYYFAVGDNTRAVVDWRPCVDPDACPSVEPRSTRSVPFGDVIFNEDYDTAIVIYHWKLIPATGNAEYTFDSVRVVTVSLR